MLDKIKVILGRHLLEHAQSEIEQGFAISIIKAAEEIVKDAKPAFECTKKGVEELLSLVIGLLDPRSKITENEKTVGVMPCSKSAALNLLSDLKLNDYLNRIKEPIPQEYFDKLFEKK